MPAAPPELRRLRYASATFAAVLLAGFVGYQVVAGLGALDALYMTVITITTVGFGELGDPTPATRVLTIGLIVSGVASASYGAVTAAEFVVEGHLRRYIERRRMQREIDDLQGHIIVCGYGRVGRHLADQLARTGTPFVVIDVEEDKLARLDDNGHPWIQGDATEEHVLQEAGLEHARALVASVKTDADNVLVTLTAKGLVPDLTVIARSKAEENEQKLRRAGADRVIAPSTIGGRRIAQILTRPAVADFLDGISTGGVDYTLEEVPVEAGSPLEGASLRDAAIREQFGCTVVAIRHGGSPKLDTHPGAGEQLEVGDLLVVMGSEPDVTHMRERCT